MNARTLLASQQLLDTPFSFDPSEGYASLRVARMMEVDFLFIQTEQKALSSNTVGDLTSKACRDLKLNTNRLKAIGVVLHEDGKTQFIAYDVQWLEDYPVLIKAEEPKNAAQVEFLHTIFEHSNPL